ncbi:Lignostilbene-alpha,beta-dioxygenase [Labilithrix luteola]|uniref:Lignostilbene-alpha,beta-dioxygenase n=1 Tax=Labilithrix luteola TaxID=1391654 RepID=A0A0K1PQ14_9BACT|nr:carotenoid oxygenase family protein [Labilithrix luteola]AKU95618.1 Lignostilbene-alpha,beta-dioxygenase [Labilithrix luteola]
MSTLTTPPFLSGPFAPVSDEITVTQLRVHGALPRELDGQLVRNGHNPTPGVVPVHWFQGSGMLHGIRLREGRADAYRNRWVRTPALAGAPYMTERGLDLTAHTAGTHAIGHAGRILALNEAGLPFQVTPELDTVGAFDFGGKLTTAMGAHPKIDPRTGELHFFGYGPFPPYLTYYVASPKGDIVRAEVVPGAGPSLMHDFAITRRHIVWFDMPVVFDKNDTSGMPYAWNSDYPARIGIMSRESGAIRWFEVDPLYVLHVTNAYDDAEGRVVLDAPAFDHAAWERSTAWWAGRPDRGPSLLTGTKHRRWTLDPEKGLLRSQTVDDLVVEFPAVNPAFIGEPFRYGYALALPAGEEGPWAMAKHDLTTGAHQLRTFRPGQLPSEGVFVPAAGATSEDAGYLLTVVSNADQSPAELLVLDATNIAGEPVAVVELPRHVPAGVHGSWIPTKA